MQNAVPIDVRDGRDDPQVSHHNKNSTRSRFGRRLGGFSRRLLVLALAFSALVPAYAATPPRAMAGSSCTGWTSKVVPPEYIRVGRGDGTVDVVKFRKYVGVVTAREWPYWLPVAARRVGAIAVKQYGWYFALAGHHRTGFVNANGKCYDVSDSTRDQLYKPEKTTVRRAIWRAVDHTWSISLRRNGNFFMTGYRYGRDVRCGADADGRLLYERSVADCARRGKSTYAILNRYISGLTVMDGGSVTTALAALASPTALVPDGSSKRTNKAAPKPQPATGSSAGGVGTRSLFPAPSVAAELLAPAYYANDLVVDVPATTTDAVAETVAVYFSPRVRGPAIV